MKNTKTLNLRNGYVKYPARWITLHNLLVPDNKAEYAGMIRVEKLHKQKCPVFIFASDIKLSNDYPEEYVNKIYKACEEAWPEFTEIRKMETLASRYSRIDITNYEEVGRFRKEISRIPEIIIYPVPEPGDPAYGTIQTRSDAPYGVVLRRV